MTNHADTPLARVFDELEVDAEEFWTIAGASTWRGFDDLHARWLKKGLIEEAIWRVLSDELPYIGRRLQAPESFERLIRERSHIYASPTRRLFHETGIDPDLFWQVPGAEKWRGFDDVYARWVVRGYDPDAIWSTLYAKRPLFLDSKLKPHYATGDGTVRASGRLQPPIFFEALIREKTLDLEADAIAMNAYDEAYDRAYDEAEQRLDASADA